MNKTSKLLAVILSLTLVMGMMPITAFGDTVGGESTVDNVIVDVTLPMALDFALDPLDLDDVAGQVTAVEFFAVNGTGVPVLVDVAVDVTPGLGVGLVDDVDDLDTAVPDNIRTIDKDVYFAILGASAVSVGANITTGSGLTVGDNNFVFDETVDGMLRVFDPSEQSASIQFALGAATGGTDKKSPQTTLAASNGGVSAFTFYAELNTYAEWDDNDLDVSGAYTLTALKESDVPETLVGLQVVAADDGDLEYDVKIAPNGSASFTVSREDAIANGIKIFLSDKPSEVLAITNTFTKNTFPTTNYTYSDTGDDEGILTITVPPGVSPGTLKILGETKTYTLNYIIND